VRAVCALSERKRTHKPLCDGTTCNKSHAAGEIPKAFKLWECRADPPYTMGGTASKSRNGGKGGDKRPGGGGGKGKGKTARK